MRTNNKELKVLKDVKAVQRTIIEHLVQINKNLPLWHMLVQDAINNDQNLKTLFIFGKSSFMHMC